MCSFRSEEGKKEREKEKEGTKKDICLISSYFERGKSVLPIDCDVSNTVSVATKNQLEAAFLTGFPQSTRKL